MISWPILSHIISVCIEKYAYPLSRNLGINTEKSMPLLMTIDDKIRYGMIALAGASLVLAALGVHVDPLRIGGGYGGS